MPEPKVYHYATKPLQAKHNKVVAIVKANPGMTRTEIGKQYYYVAKLMSYQRTSISNMLLICCIDNRIKYIETDRYE